MCICCLAQLVLCIMLQSKLCSKQIIRVNTLRDSPATHPGRLNMPCYSGNTVIKSVLAPVSKAS